MTPPSPAASSAPLSTIEPACWSADDIAAISDRAVDYAPPIKAGDFKRVSENLDIWDAWPIQQEDGMPAPVAPGERLWMALGAPRLADPNDRHWRARIHLLQDGGAGWRDLGLAMPEAFSPGSREWSGSAVLAADGKTVTLYFTAAGRRGEAKPSVEQRLFSADATLERHQDAWRLSDWRGLHEAIIRDATNYMASDAGTGALGTIKAFRDPAYFRDPYDGRHYLFFAGSRAGARSAFNGVIGAAVAVRERGAKWRILAPLIDASGLNNELERPHVVMHRGLYYLFWSTQSEVFDPTGPIGPTGLYGMVSERLTGGWRPLNDTGLVFANPRGAPRQAYSWLVLPDLSVISFVDDWGRGPCDAEPRRFGGTFAPPLRLRLERERAGLR